MYFLLFFRSCYPTSFWSFCHFPQHSNPLLFLSISLSLSLTQQPRGLSLLSWVVFFFFFSHILRKSSLFLLSSVDSPLTVMKQHRGISEEEEGLKTPLSSLCLIYWGIKEKMKSRGSLEMNTSRRAVWHVGREPA